MRRLVFIFIAICGMTSCGTASLYYWGSGSSASRTAYESMVYKRYDKQTPESLCKLICIYEDMVMNPGGVRKMPPPGICAEYGYILLDPETAAIFAANATAAQKRIFGVTDYEEFFHTKGKEMMEKEIELYPESAVFIAPLIEKLKARYHEKTYSTTASIGTDNTFCHFMRSHQHSHTRGTICRNV